MSDKKISQLTAATTPLAGTEVLPIVQSGATVKVAVSDLTDGLSTIPTTKGGTGLTSFTSNGVVYATSTSALTTSANLLFDGRTLGVGGAVLAAWGGAYGRAQIGNALSMFSNSAAIATYAANIYNAGAGVIKYINTGAASQYVQNSGAHVWSTAVSGNANDTITFTEQLNLSAAGDLNVKVGNLVIGTAGKGIDFSADPSAAGMTSELLDDYEEGTFTPTLTGFTVVGTNTSSGRYIKVGNIVHATILLEASTSLSTSGASQIALPFSTKSGTSASGFIISANSGSGSGCLAFGLQTYIPNVLAASASFGLTFTYITD